MAERAYDFWAETLDAHGENGYLLFLLGGACLYDLVLVLALVFLPPVEIYQVPGVDRVGQASVQWGAAPPQLSPVRVAPEPLWQPRSSVIELAPEALPAALPAAPAAGEAP